MRKIINDTELDQIKDNNIVLAGGCFDIIHPGHIEFLENAKKCGDKLYILLESDENIKKIKGKNRPVNNQIVRAKNLSDLSIVDKIILLSIPKSDTYYYNLVKMVRPAIIAVTSNDPLLENKKEQAKIVGGKVEIVMDRNKKFSTTDLVNKKIL